MNSRSRPKTAVLVIDDEQIVHDSVRRILEQEGYLVDGAFRVDQALEKLAKQPYDLVLTDLMMPDRSGMEVVETGQFEIVEKPGMDFASIPGTGLLNARFWPLPC